MSVIFVILKWKCPIKPCKQFKMMICRQFTLGQWVWLSNTSRRGHLTLCMCKRCCCQDQLWRGSGYICHLPHTRSESWASPTQAHRRKATPPQGRGILQRQARFQWYLSLLSCGKHFFPFHVCSGIIMPLTEICLDLYHRQVTAGNYAELSQTLLPFTWLKIKRYVTAWDRCCNRGFGANKDKNVRHFDKFWLLSASAFMKLDLQPALTAISWIANHSAALLMTSLFPQIGKTFILLLSIVTKKVEKYPLSVAALDKMQNKMWMTIYIYLWGDMRVWHKRLEPQSGPPASE